MRRAIARRRAKWCRRYRRGRPSVFRPRVGFEPGHHGAKLRPDFLDQVGLLAPPRGVERRTARLVFEDPGPSEGAVLDLAQDLAHLLAYGGAAGARATHVVAELRRVADAVTHVAHPTLVHEVDDQLHLVQALEIGELRLIAGFHQGF